MQPWPPSTRAKCLRTQSASLSSRCLRHPPLPPLRADALREALAACFLGTLGLTVFHLVRNAASPASKAHLISPVSRGRLAMSGDSASTPPSSFVLPLPEQACLLAHYNNPCMIAGACFYPPAKNCPDPSSGFTFFAIFASIGAAVGSTPPTRSAFSR